MTIEKLTTDLWLVSLAGRVVASVGQVDVSGPHAGQYRGIFKRELLWGDTQEDVLDQISKRSFTLMGA